MNAEKIIAALCDLSYLNDNAQGLAKSLYELGLCDDLMNPEDAHSRDEKRMLKVYELLRLHNTSSRLVCVLSDTLDSIREAIERLDAATVEKPDGIPGTETTPPEKLRKCAEIVTFWGCVA